MKIVLLSLIIVTSLQLPHIKPASDPKKSVVPRLENDRHKIIWSQDTIEDYANLITPVLEELRNSWLEDPTP